MTSALVTGPLVLDLEHNYEDFTPIARLAADQLLIVVPANSEFQTIEDLLEAAKAAPDEVSWGGTGLGGEDSLLLGQIEQASGANLNYISFESGGEVQVALLGGHIDVASSNPNEIIGQLEAGELRPLAVAGDARLEGAAGRADLAGERVRRPLPAGSRRRRSSRYGSGSSSVLGRSVQGNDRDRAVED